MRAVVTRVLSASVEIGGRTAGAIEKGFLILLGVHEEDTEAEAKKIADKICGLRVFEDAAGKMNLAPDPAEKKLLIILLRQRRARHHPSRHKGAVRYADQDHPRRAAGRKLLYRDK